MAGPGDTGFECAICQDTSQLTVGTVDSCNHAFCFPCVKGWLQQSSTCPICKSAVKLLNKHDLCEPVRGGELSTTQIHELILARGAPAEVLPIDEKKLRSDHWDEGEPASEEDTDVPFYLCEICGVDVDAPLLLLCDGCDLGYHTYCTGLEGVPEGDWFCPACEQGMHAPPSTARRGGRRSSARVASASAIADPHQQQQRHAPRTRRAATATATARPPLAMSSSENDDADSDDYSDDDTTLLRQPTMPTRRTQQAPTRGAQAVASLRTDWPRLRSGADAFPDASALPYTAPQTRTGAARTAAAHPATARTVAARTGAGAVRTGTARTASARTGAGAARTGAGALRSGVSRAVAASARAAEPAPVPSSRRYSTAARRAERASLAARSRLADRISQRRDDSPEDPDSDDALDTRTNFSRLLRTRPNNDTAAAAAAATQRVWDDTQDLPLAHRGGRSRSLRSLAPQRSLTEARPGSSSSSARGSTLLPRTGARGSGTPLAQSGADKERLGAAMASARASVMMQRTSGRAGAWLRTANNTGPVPGAVPGAGDDDAPAHGSLCFVNHARGGSAAAPAAAAYTPSRLLAYDTARCPFAPSVPAAAAGGADEASTLSVLLSHVARPPPGGLPHTQSGLQQTQGNLPQIGVWRPESPLQTLGGAWRRGGRRAPGPVRSFLCAPSGTAATLAARPLSSDAQAARVRIDAARAHVPAAASASAAASAPKMHAPGAASAKAAAGAPKTHAHGMPRAASATATGAPKTHAAGLPAPMPGSCAFPAAQEQQQRAGNWLHVALCAGSEAGRAALDRQHARGEGSSPSVMALDGQARWQWGQSPTKKDAPAAFGSQAHHAGGASASAMPESDGARPGRMCGQHKRRGDASGHADSDGPARKRSRVDAADQTAPAPHRDKRQHEFAHKLATKALRVCDGAQADGRSAMDASVGEVAASIEQGLQEWLQRAAGLDADAADRVAQKALQLPYKRGLLDKARWNKAREYLSSEMLKFVSQLRS